MVNDKVENEGLDEASKEFTDLINSYQNGMLNEEMSKAVETRMENVLKELVKLEDLKNQACNSQMVNKCAMTYLKMV